MRNLVTCKVCDRLLYEPYALACGHTYCYSCLSEWLVTSHKKTCPDCRAAVTEQPTPNYIIRELVLVFVSRSELLPDGETSEEHHKFAKEEGEIVAKDRGDLDPSEGGLFKGRFGRARRPILLPIRDPGDGVDRCPQCHWELEEDFCNQCGIAVDGEDHGGWSDYDDESGFTDDEMDHELDMEDAEAVWGADGQDDYTGFEGRRRNVINFDLMSSDQESDDDEHDPELQNFIADDQSIEEASSEDEGTHAPGTIRARPAPCRRAPVVISDDDDATAASAGQPGETEQDSEDEGPVAHGPHRRKRGPLVPVRQRQARTISSGGESSENDADDDDGSEVVEWNVGGFSPLDPKGHAAIDDGSVGSGSDDGSETTSSIHPTFDDDEEEEEESDGSDDGCGPRYPLGYPSDLKLTGLADTRRGETPSNGGPLHHAASHRLHSLGQRRDRHISTLGGPQSLPAASPLNRRAQDPNLRRSYHPRDRSPRRATQAPQTAYNRGLFQGYLGNNRAPPPPYQVPQSMNHLPAVHPFRRDETLANISYNQRNHDVRANPSHRNVSGGSSQSSTGGGGVGVQPSSSSGSSTTIGPATAARRKRALSISSDESAQ